MSAKKIILCPNPNRDQGMKTTKAAEAILREAGFSTVVCSPFRDRKEGAFADYEVHPLLRELRGAALLITFGGDGTILHLAKLAALHKIPVLGINMGGLGFVAELEASELETLRKLKDWQFKAPVFFGDTIHCRSVVSEIRNSRSKPDRGVLKLAVEIIKQDGTVCQTGTKVLLMRRSRPGECGRQE